MKKLILTVLLFAIFSCSEDTKTLLDYQDTPCDSCIIAKMVEHASFHMNDTTSINIVADSLYSDTIKQEHIRYNISLKENTDSLHNGNISVYADENDKYIFFGDKAIKILLLDSLNNVVPYDIHKHVEQDGIEVIFVYTLTKGFHNFQIGPGPATDSIYNVVFEKYNEEEDE